MSSPLNFIRIIRNFSLFVVGLTTALLPTYTSAQIQIWGVSSSGGADGIGSVFNVLDDGSAFDSSFEFQFYAEGHTAQSPMVLGSDGAFYGTTTLGGQFNNGTIYRFTELEGLTVLHHFDGLAGGANSQGNLVETTTGTFVGCAASGGANGVGIIFQFDLTAGFQVLHNFVAATNGAAPAGQIIFDSGLNAIYGSCVNGGAQGFGTIYRYNLTGTLTTLHTFSSAATGTNPRGGLTKGSDDLLYGTCQFGGLHAQGNIFQFDPSTSLINTLYELNSATSDGRFPLGSLTESSPGTFLGTCSSGGLSGAGTIIRITATGTFTRLRSLSSSADGSSPKSALTNGNDGQFYGVTDLGGSGGGTFYRINEAGTFFKIRNFATTTDGINGLVRPTLASANTMLVPLSNGGVTNDGTILKYTIGGTFAKLHDFSLPIDGENPQSLLATEGGFLGTTLSGGAFNAGALFLTGLNGETTKLHDFNPSVDGQQPNGQLCATGSGTYLGTTQFGGLFESGTVFSIDLAGNLTTLHHFDGADEGFAPFGGLLKHSDGFYYGTTSLGGIYGEGIIYRITETGDFTYLQSCFGFFDGGNPESTPAEGLDGLIYFTNRFGGNSGSGTLASYNILDESITVAHHFSGGADGGLPMGNLVSDASSAIYGTCSVGGSGGGTLFKYTETENLTTLHTFLSAAEGSTPEGGVSLDINDKVYGFCKMGGLNNQGSIYTYSDADGFAVAFSTTANNGPRPSGVPALFYPECLNAGDCLASDPCNVAFCNFGVCEEAAINPVFEPSTIGNCDPATNGFTLLIELTLNASPGGNLILGDQSFELDAGTLTYTLELTGLDANGEAINLDYTFETTGCTGQTGELGIAPIPCPPVFLGLTLHTDNLTVGAEGVFVGGNFQGWNPSQYPMTEVEPDVYTVIIPLSAGAYEFNFFNGSSIFDGEFVIGACAINGKRQLNVAEEGLELEYCWASCQETCTITGINDREITKVNVWPNPVSAGGQLNLTASDTWRNGTYRIWSIDGRLVQGKKLISLGTLATEELKSGIYTLEIMDELGAISGYARFAVM